MKGQQKKQHAVVTFTVHTLKLPKPYSDPFGIEYKRGNNDGLTERAIAGSGETEVNFEKRFRVAVTFYISKKDQHIRKKKIAPPIPFTAVTSSFLCHIRVISAFTPDSLIFLNRLYPATLLCATCHIVFSALILYNKQTMDGKLSFPSCCLHSSFLFHNMLRRFPPHFSFCLSSQEVAGINFFSYNGGVIY